MSSVLEPDADRRVNLSLGDALAVIVLLPGVVYGAGYFMWVAPSLQLYGANLAPKIGISGLLVPGICYTVTLVLAAVFAVVVGSRSLIRLPWPRRREVRVFGELVLWALSIFAISIASNIIAHNTTSAIRSGPSGSTIYVVTHLLVVGFTIRRLFGILRSRLTHPAVERRRTSWFLRVAQGLLAMLLLYVQIPLALLFGALGPNPVRQKFPATVFLGAQTDANDRGYHSSRVVDIVDSNDERLLVYDERSRIVVAIPQREVKEIRWAK